ncbi:hypothetical protein [Streptomyces sp. NPDC089915]|uniref:hypothetical protein n=1 Tax=Streptomyces sp. NPDC089915 TaxID=3155186 RepID=UPI0034191B39
MASSPAPGGDPEPGPSPGHDGRTRHGRRSRGKALAAAGAVLTAVVVAAVTVPVEDGVKRLFGIGREEPAQKATDLQLVARQVAFQGATDGWIAPGKILPEGAGEEISAVIRGWQRVGEAVPAWKQVITFSLQSSTPKAITIDSLHIEKRCRPALAGPWFRVRGGGGVSSKEIKVDLDSPVTEIVPASGDMAVDPRASPVTGFPFVVTEQEMAWFTLTVKAKEHDCDWKGVLKWSADGKAGTTDISDGGRMLRLTGTAAATGTVFY